ncbi:MAG: hypothetical protein CMA72_06760 [Euryarchaeota archaeon]|nr:hypothetical protein [Euryarchaeota archaeon]|tara:strand:+ start:12093 stop:12353 length:261 start_codon:yes stop_codon:yes gene_type:complete
MKITKSQLKRIIKEERAKLVNEAPSEDLITLAAIENHIGMLKRMLDVAVDGGMMSYNEHDDLVDALYDVEGALQKVAEGGSGAPSF